MVYIRRIAPEDGISRIFKGLTSRVQSLETSPSGNVVIRETLSTVDPESGVGTVLGQLPDGSYGLQEFVNDTTPPGKPSTPVAEAALSGAAITWDGLEASGAIQPKDFARTEIHYRPAASDGSWAVGGVIYDATSTIVPNLVAGTSYSFSLVSFDTNNNPSDRSETVTATPLAILDNSDVADALAEVREEAATATRNSATAQGAAKTAQDAAEAAARDALAAANMTAGAGKANTIFSATAPTEAAEKTGSTLWIDISGTPPKNTPNRWDGNAWVAITDKTAVDAAAAAARAETQAGAAAVSAATAATAAGDAQTAANNKNRVWYLDTAPAGSSHAVNDIWFDAANGNKPMRWDGGDWVSAQDAAIETAQGAATAALTAAGSKNKIVFSESDASGTVGYVAGDLWMKRDATGSVIGQWEFTTSWQKRTIGEEVLGNLSAGKITSGFIDAERLDANTIRAKIIAADKIRAEDILLSGSITADSGIIGSLDAAKITAGILNAARLASKSITTDKLLITSSDNVIQEPDFSAEGVSWGSRNTTTLMCVTGAGRGGGNVLRFTGATLSQASVNNQPRLPVDPESSYSGHIWVKSNAALGANKVRLVMRCWSTAAAYVDVPLASNTTALVINTWTEVNGLTTAAYGKVPADTINVQFYLQVVNAAATNITDVDYVSAIRKADASLIVDGSIDGKTITGALIQSVSAASRGIKISDTQFIAYSNTGVETLRFDGANSILTGATIRTATSGARVQLDSTGLAAWNSANAEVFRINNGSVTMQGSITASGVTQAQTMPARPSRPISLSLGPSMPVYQGGSITSDRVPGMQWVTPTSTMLTPPQVYSSSGEGLTIASGLNGDNEWSNLDLYDGVASLTSSGGTTVTSHKGVVTIKGVAVDLMGPVTHGTKELSGDGEIWTWTNVSSATGIATGPGIPTYSDGTDKSTRMGTWTADTYTVKEAGFYSFDFFLDMVSYVAHGWQSLSRGTGAAFAEGNFADAGSNTLSVGFVRMAANQPVRVRWVQVSKTQNMNGSLAIRRVA